MIFLSRTISMKNSDHFKWLDQIPIKGTPGATSAFGWSNNAIFQYRMFWANTQHKCTQSGNNKFVGASPDYIHGLLAATSDW